MKPNWEIIRSKANVLGLILATPLSMEVVVLVERGAKIETNKFIGKPLASEGFTYIEQYNEKT